MPMNGAAWHDMVDAHALALYLICVLAALAGAHAARDFAEASRQERAANRNSRRVEARALVVLMVAVSIFGGLAATFSRFGWTRQLDQHVHAAVSALDDQSLRAAALIVTHLGEPVVLTVVAGLVAIALVLRRQWRLVLVAMPCVAANGFLVRVLKEFFERARPVSTQTFDHVSGWSFPSGHAAGTMMVCASAAWFAWRWLPRHWNLFVLIVMAALTIGVGASRIVLGVHYTSDVLAGFALAVAHVALMIMLLESPRRRQGAPRSTPLLPGDTLK